MPYRVLKDGATVPADAGTRKSLRDGTEFKVYRTNVYTEGYVLADNQVSQVVKDKLEDGDERVSSLLEYTDDDPTDADVDNVSDRWQAENGGEVDEPRKIQQAVTRLDSERNLDKADVQAKSVAEE